MAGQTSDSQFSSFGHKILHEDKNFLVIDYCPTHKKVTKNAKCAGLSYVSSPGYCEKALTYFRHFLLFIVAKKSAKKKPPK